MPGIVVFRRRWSVGSDDLVVPGVFLFTMHLIWTVVLATLLAMVKFDTSKDCILYLWEFVLGYLVVLGLSLITECAICIVAMRGSILDTAPRASMQYLLYLRLVIMLLETALLVIGIVWLVYYYTSCDIEGAKETLLGLVVCNWCVLVSILITVWCTYDTAGRSWVKMKQFQRSMRESESRFQYKRSGNRNRNWRQRKVIRAYQDSWDQRCRFLFCCMRPSDRNRNSFADIARLLSDFFRDLDVVPSDVVAGLVLLRKFQKIEQKAIVEQRKNDTYEFLSGVAVTPRTQFLALHESSADLQLFNTVIYYMNFALGAYGWPVFLMTYSTTGICQLCTKLRCCCLSCCAGGSGSKDNNTSAAMIIEDNCCRCNYAALQRILTIGDIDIIYVTYHVDVGETPFFVAVDYDKKKIIISIRGTLSMKDVLTDLNAEGDTLPLNPPKEDWTGHKGMIEAAKYIRDKLYDENLLEKAFNHNPERGTNEFGLILVGHSLGAGTASILAILLKQEYADLQCFSYSPPGGLLSMPAVEYTKSFITSVVVGKDVVPRIGLHQMEALRADLINAIKRSIDPKWKTITCSVICCGCGPEPRSAQELSTTDANIVEYMAAKDSARAMGVHPSDSTIALTLHNPLYPPGRIIHIVRHHPKKGEQAISSHEPVYQALWAQNTDFDEVLISPVMIQDHMPDKVLEALNKVVTTFGPKKPQRNPATGLMLPMGADHLDSEHCQLLAEAPACSPKFLTPQQRKLCLETSFTSLQSPSIEYHSSSLNSSITNGYYSSKSQTSPIQLTSIITLLDEKLRNRPHQPDRKNLSLNLPAPRPALKKIDLIYDDWFGLAPLASPESLSEVSSISSRASCAFHLEKCNLNDALSSSYELRTPKVMRRTPKIPGNLSTCADDIRSVRYFQKLGQNSKVYRPQNEQSSFTSSGDLSYESATSSSLTRCCSGEHVPEIIFNNSHKYYVAGIAEEQRDDDQDEEFIAAEVQIVNERQNASTTVQNNSNSSDSFQSAENILDEDESKLLFDHLKLVQTHEEPSGDGLVSIKKQTVYMETHFDNEEIFKDSRCTCDENDAHLDDLTEDYDKTTRSLEGVSIYREKVNLIRPILRSPMDVKYFAPSRSSNSSSKTSPHVLSPSTPQEIDPDLMANFAMDLNLDEENRSMHFCNPSLIRPGSVEAPSTKANSIDSGSICRTPSESKNVTFNPQVINIDPKLVSRTSPVSSEESPNRAMGWLSRKTDKWHLLPGRGNKKSSSKSAKKITSASEAEIIDSSTNNSPLKMRPDDDQCFSKNESLPLLKGLSGSGHEKTSPNFVRRKKYVYPITSIGKGESSV